MQAYIREKLIEEIIYSEKLVSQYRSNNTKFIQNMLNWLDKLEKELSKLRHPLCGILSIEQAKILTTLEGNITIMKGVSKRKAMRFQAIESLEITKRELVKVINNIDNKFDLWKEKIAQLAAISSKNSPILISNENELTSLRLAEIWKSFGSSQEGYNMHQYLSAVMPKADLMYILNEIILNILSNQSNRS